MIVKFRDEKRGPERIHSRVFIGPDADHLQLAGEIEFSHIGEWQLFGTAILMGSRRMGGQLQVEFPDDLEIVRGEPDGQREPAGRKE